MSNADQTMSAVVHRPDAKSLPGFSAAVLKRAHAGAVAAFALLSAFPAYLAGFPLRLNHVAALALIASFGAVALGLRRVPRISNGTLVAGKFLVIYGCCAVAVSALLSAPAAKDPLDAYSYALRFLLGAVLVVALPAVAVTLGSRARWITGAFFLGGTASSLLAIIGYRLPDLGAITIGVGRRAESLFDHPNQFGMVVLALFPLALAYALEAPRRPLRWFAAVVIAIGVVLSGSFVNTLLLVAGAALLLLTAFASSLSLRHVIWGLAATLLLAASLAVVGTDRIMAASPRVAGMLSAFQESGDLEDRLPSVDERLALYRSALETWRTQPLFGVGADNADHYLTRPSGAPSSHAHNMFINTALTTGIVGLVALSVLVAGWLLIAFGLLIGRGLRSRDLLLAKGVGTALLLLLLSNQSSDSLSGTVIYPLWVLLGIAFALTTAKGSVGDSR